MDNLQIYNAVRIVPPEALREIKGGRLKGMSDINPMWRMKVLTEQFGMVGIGWSYTIDRRWLEPAPNGEIAAFVEIGLRVKVNGEWSEPIPGTGGSSFLANERNGMYMSDECYKMALTDAISVACKALGVAADVYWEKDATKYNPNRPEQQSPPPEPQPPVICPICDKLVAPIKKDGVITSPKDVLAKIGMCKECYRAKMADTNG